MIYLDNAATTRMDPEVFEAMEPYLKEQYGNPSAQYELGIEARKAVEEARETIALCLNAKPDEIYFTSGGTESDNWILSQAWEWIISTPIEHHAIHNNVLKGIHYQEVGVNKYGRIIHDELIDALENSVPEKTCVSIMYGNNEIGTIQDMSMISELCLEYNVFLHTDAVQAFGHVPIDVKRIKVDALSASSHKFNGPKGVGFLYVREGFDLKPMMRGGKQESNSRAGTENVAGIVGMAKAAEIATRDMKDNIFKINEIRNHLYGEITNKIPRAHLNGTADWRIRLPGSLNFRFDGVHGEELVEWLNQNGICTSSGSACASGTGKPSHVLTAIGLTPEEARSSVRFSIGKYNHKKEVAEVMKALDYYLTTICPGGADGV